MKTKKSPKTKNASTVKTSKEQSHSVWSNVKLTFISLVATLSFSGLFVFLGLKDALSQTVFHVGALTCSVFIAVTLVWFAGFKR